MGKRVITPEMIEQIGYMVNHYSSPEIAERLHISLRSVKTIIKKYNYQRSAEAMFQIQSRRRREVIKAERRRALFGLEQHTRLKVFTNHERIRLRQMLKRRSYIILSRNAKTIYYNENTQRLDAFEERGRKLNLKFERLESTTN